MTKYYFLTDPDQSYIVGPFITVRENTSPFQYYGQVIRSNEFGELYSETQTYRFVLWCWDSLDVPALGTTQAKYKLIDSLKNLDNICVQIGVLEGQINKNNPVLEIRSGLNSRSYKVEFRIMGGTICCPTLTIG
jgi:hypothetical protein